MAPKLCPNEPSVTRGIVQPDEPKEGRTQRARRIIEEARVSAPERPALREIMFDYSDLRDIDLSQFDLRYCSFYDCDLRGAKLPSYTTGDGAPDFTAARREPDDPPLAGWTLCSGFLVRDGTQNLDDVDGNPWPFSPDTSD
jgi:uncharacterized protein YjbI with pentapeptide repeats